MTPTNTPDPDTSPAAPTGKLARFTLHDGMVLEIHIPGATRVETADTPARTAGFTLRRGQELVNVGVLSLLFPSTRTADKPPAPRSDSRVARRPRRV